MAVLLVSRRGQAVAVAAEATGSPLESSSRPAVSFWQKKRRDDHEAIGTGCHQADGDAQRERSA